MEDFRSHLLIFRHLSPNKSHQVFGTTEVGLRDRLNYIHTGLMGTGVGHRFEFYQIDSTQIMFWILN